MSPRLISSTVGFISITDADKVIAEGEIKQYKAWKEICISQHPWGKDVLMFVSQNWIVY